MKTPAPSPNLLLHLGVMLFLLALFAAVIWVCYTVIANMSKDHERFVLALIGCGFVITVMATGMSIRYRQMMKAGGVKWPRRGSSREEIEKFLNCVGENAPRMALEILIMAAIATALMVLVFFLLIRVF